MFDKESVLKYLYDEIKSCDTFLDYQSNRYAIDVKIDTVVSIQSSRDKKAFLKRLIYKIEGCEFDK